MLIVFSLSLFLLYRKVSYLAYGFWSHSGNSIKQCTHTFTNMESLNIFIQEPQEKCLICLKPLFITGLWTVMLWTLGWFFYLDKYFFFLWYFREKFPSHFKFKEYCPLVFRHLRERFNVDDQEFAVSTVLVTVYIVYIYYMPLFGPLHGNPGGIGVCSS